MSVIVVLFLQNTQGNTSHDKDFKHRNVELHTAVRMGVVFVYPTASLVTAMTVTGSTQFG